MSRIRKGFTLIEISIFLAVTGLLFAMVTIGVQNSIYQQRYNDTVQSFADFLRNIYSGVENVQSLGDGRHDVAIYGKMVSFGQTMDLEGNAVESGQPIFVYDVIADATDASEISSGNTLGQLKALNANVVIKNEDKFELVGVIQEYTPKWSARIQKTSDYKNYVGTILVVRNPSSGAIKTFVLDGETINVNELLSGSENDASLDVFNDGVDGNYLDRFVSEDVDFCVNPSGDEEDRNRVDVRLKEKANNSSGVEVISFDSEDNKCNKGE